MALSSFHCRPAFKYPRESGEKSTLPYYLRSTCTVGTGREPKEFKEADNQLILLALVWKHQPKKSVKESDLDS